MADKQQADRAYIEDRVCWTLTSIVQHLQSLQALISSLPQAEGNNFQALVTEALQNLPSHVSIMSRATPDDQLRFLVSCVKHSNSGKVDFVEVAKECGVVSKGAAAKRYERLLKANDLHFNSGSTESLQRKAATPSVKQKPKEVHEKPAASKKRKADCDLPVPPSKPEAKHSSLPETNKIAKTDPVAGFPENSQAIRGRHPPYGASSPGMPSGPPPPRFLPRQMPAQVYHHQAGRVPFQDFQGFRNMPSNHLSQGLPLSMPPMLPVTRDQLGFSLEHFDGQNNGLEEYLNTNMYYQEPMPQAIQSHPSLLNEMLPMSLPPRPQEVQPLPQSGESSASPASKGKNADGSIVIVD